MPNATHRLILSGICDTNGWLLGRPVKSQSVNRTVSQSVRLCWLTKDSLWRLLSFLYFVTDYFVSFYFILFYFIEGVGEATPVMFDLKARFKNTLQPNNWIKFTWVFCCPQKPRNQTCTGPLLCWRNKHNLANTSSSEAASATLGEEVSADIMGWVSHLMPRQTATVK